MPPISPFLNRNAYKGYPTRVPSLMLGMCETNSLSLKFCRSRGILLKEPYSKYYIQGDLHLPEPGLDYDILYFELMLR